MFEELKRYLQFNLINRAIIKNKSIDVTKRNCKETSLLFYSLHYTTEDRLEIKGSGGTYDEKVSLIKAWSELVERISVKNYAYERELIVTSSGFAAHPDKNKSKINSLNEIVERDSFAVSWLLGIPAKSIEILKELDNNSKYINKVKKLYELGLDLYFGELPKCMGVYVFVCYIFGDVFQLELSANKSRKKAVESIIENAARQIMFRNLINKERKHTFTKEPQSIENQLVNIKMNKERFLKKWFKNEINEVIELPSFRYKYENLTKENEFAISTGLKVYKCTSREAQNIWFGPTKDTDINYDRIESVKKHLGLGEIEINYDPHPLP